MRISLEVFGIPGESLETVREAVHSGAKLHLAARSPDRPPHRIIFQEGTCPYTGDRYLSVAVDGLDTVDLECCNKFFRSVYLAHPCKDSEEVRNNMQLRIEDPYEVKADGSPFEEQETLDEDTCWICGRINGEERPLTDGQERLTIEVTWDDGRGVSLCNVCRKLLISGS